MQPIPAFIARVSRKDNPTHHWLLQAANHPDIVKRMSPWIAGEGPVVLDHIDEASHAFLTAVCISTAVAANKSRSWILCDSPRHRERLAMELELWGVNALLLPDPPRNIGDEILSAEESSTEWFSILHLLSSSCECTVLCASDAFASQTPAPHALQAASQTLRPGDHLDPSDFIRTLEGQAFERVATVVAPGQFAVRGGIIDLFPWNAAYPMRLDFFDTTLESIREFDPDSQASTRKRPHADLQLSEPGAEAFLVEYRRKEDVIISIDSPWETPDFAILSGAREQPAEEDFTAATFGSPFGTLDAGDFVLDELRRENFFRQVNEWHREGWDIAMVFSNKGERERFTELAGKSLRNDLGITPVTGELLAGFTFPLLRLAVLSSSELFGRYRNPVGKRRSTLEKTESIRSRASLDEIEEGDLVIHYEYGLARYLGIHAGDDGEELLLEYRDGIHLGVPLEQAHLVGKYIGMGGKTPDLSKLGGTSWKSARRAAEKSIADYAAQLLRIQAEREHEPGYAHPPDTRWMWEFENSFHYTETPDQRQAIEETKSDMEQARPMDRLICGDVGFGKTEVAIRAAFKAVTSGKQVAILVPTTVLAEQHWRNFRERMSDYPVRIDLLNRFRSAAEIRQTIAGLSDGSVDIVIGTHRLVSGDITFKNLGLVVVDEEQRFGVAHKEKFKHLFRQIDVLTLSATPIPRTLYMALMGARDMSTIDTPPPNRVPVSTIISAYDERVIRDAIRREMKRGGQVFFLHNRVKSIEIVARRLRELVPEARILVGHGQMDREDLESVMHAFIRGEADVLLATTIIETGIDIPNANTILIDRADRFGLADLYQLRGRVGRAGEKAYAILLLPRDMVTAGDARKRIHAIKQYTALGSGFKIAMRDLEIRGAGNLLGTKQSGHIAQIGFELYCQLLRQSVERLKGRKHALPVECTFKADFLVTSENARETSSGSTLPAYLPARWLPDTRLRITAYRELAQALSESAIDRLEQSWADRFGRLPSPAVHLLLVARVKALASSKGIGSVEINGQRLMLHRNGDYILLEGRRFPRLQSPSPLRRIEETIDLLRNF